MLFSFVYLFFLFFFSNSHYQNKPNHFIKTGFHNSILDWHGFKQILNYNITRSGFAKFSSAKSTFVRTNIVRFPWGSIWATKSLENNNKK